MLPVLFRVGPFPVHSWGVFLMLGFLLATARTVKNARRYRIPADAVWDIALWGLLGGVVGARLVYVLLSWGEFAKNPLSALHLWEGGMTFYGGLFGGILAGVLACRARGVDVWDMADLAALAFPIGYAFGRVGCFLNGCCYGGQCDISWLAARFHTADGGLTAPSHPAQLYSALAGVLMYALLVPLENRRRFRGQLMLAFLFVYSVYRFLIEFVREGVTAQTTSLLGLTQGQVASLLFAVLALCAYVFLARRRAVPTTPPRANVPTT
jgi:phosphatidylglycerol:prolipoprotein diacylglycerol transferase